MLHPDWLTPPHCGHPPSNLPIRPMQAPLDVVTAISNPQRYRSRYSLFRDFEKMVRCAGARLTVVELAYGDRPFEITDPSNPRHHRFRSPHQLWHKENLLNLGIGRLPSDWQYVATVDADVAFARHDWVQETIQRLQHHPVVQMFCTCHDLGPNHETFASYDGFVSSWIKNDRKLGLDAYAHRKGNWHPGYAWAYRREAIDQLGGLIDTAALGSGDRHMAYGLVGEMPQSIHPDLSRDYGEQLMIWQARAERYIRRNVGYVPGTISHFWHGRKPDRRYNDRWKVLTDSGYSPSLDLKRDWQGVFQLTERSIPLRDGIAQYFASRNEDSSDLAA